MKLNRCQRCLRAIAGAAVVCSACLGVTAAQHAEPADGLHGDVAVIRTVAAADLFADRPDQPHIPEPGFTGPPPGAPHSGTASVFGGSSPPPYSGGAAPTI